MMTPERRAEMDDACEQNKNFAQLGPALGVDPEFVQMLTDSLAEIDRMTAERNQLSNALDLAAAELEAQTKEIDRLNKVVDQAINWIPNIDRKCIVPQGCYSELAAELERRSKA